MTDLANEIRAGVTNAPSLDRPAGIELTQYLSPVNEMPVHPPSYDGRLEIHDRILQGEEVSAIELDSVGSSANRIEECLKRLYDAGDYSLPVLKTNIPTGERTHTLTTLDTPHRLFDGWIRYSSVDPDGETDFENSELGQELTRATMAALDPILETSAHDLLFGTWSSHAKGPLGQVRIARALTSTLIGLNPIPQATFAARKDPLNLGDKETKFRNKKLSEEGLSSIPPQQSIPYEEENGRVKRFGKSGDKLGHRGGVSISSALYQAYISFPALRRLGFERYDAEAVRAMLAWLGLYGLLLRCADGWDLRSRCVLYPDGAPRIRLVQADGTKQEVVLDIESAKVEFEKMVSAAKIDDRKVELFAGKDLAAAVEKALKSGDSDSA